MEIIYKEVEELTPYEKNPRKNDKAVKYVAESIEQFGFKVPIVIDRDNVIVTGHTRLKASKQLGLSKVPCIIADDLTEDQIKAFRLADNKVAEMADWDFDLLHAEIEDLPEFDMEAFGFEEFNHEQNVEDNTYAVQNILNLAKRQFEGVGFYDIPQIEPVYELPDGIEEWIGFNYVLSDKHPENKAVHFFIDDYQFERVWNNPDAYVDKLKQYKAVLSPDFSPYGNMPHVTQIYNHYRKHWVGSYLQEKGITIIPTIRSSTDERSFDWYLDGEPKGGVVAYSSMWYSNEEIRAINEQEWETMCITLRPKLILVYGEITDKMRKSGIELRQIETFANKRFGGKEK